ncbi:MAG: nucleoside-triphosphatase [Acidiferrobacterales bacterium]
MQQHKHILLLTGAPGVGKTTVIRRVAERLSGRQLGGFYTEEIRGGGTRQGFRLATFDGEEIVMAHIDYPNAQRVGRYGVDVSSIDDVATRVLGPDTDKDIYVIDEIGKMECLSVSFVKSMRVLFGSGKPVVATVAAKGSGLIADVKRRQDAELWRVTSANRDDLPTKVVTWLDLLQG